MVRDKKAHGTRGQDLCLSRATSSEMSGFIWSSDLRVVRKRTAMADNASFSRASYLPQSLSNDVCILLPCARQAAAAAKYNRLSATDFSATTFLPQTFLLLQLTVCPPTQWAAPDNCPSAPCSHIRQSHLSSDAWVARRTCIECRAFQVLLWCRCLCARRHVR